MKGASYDGWPAYTTIHVMLSKFTRSEGGALLKKVIKKMRVYLYFILKQMRKTIVFIYFSFRVVQMEVFLSRIFILTRNIQVTSKWIVPFISIYQSILRIDFALGDYCDGRMIAPSLSIPIDPCEKFQYTNREFYE